MRATSARARALMDEQEATAKGLAEAMIAKSDADEVLEFDVGRQRVRAVMPTAEMWEAADVEAYWDPSGKPLDLPARQRRLQRILLSKCVTAFEDEVEFDLGDEKDDVLKLLIIGKLPEPMVQRMWDSMLAQRNALMLALMTSVGEAVKKSPASPTGEPNGDSSGPRDASASAESGSPI